MARASDSHSDPHSDPHAAYPGEMLERHHADWHMFTHYVVKTCVGVAAVLLLMLLAFKVF